MIFVICSAPTYLWLQHIKYHAEQKTNVSFSRGSACCSQEAATYLQTTVLPVVQFYEILKTYVKMPELDELL